MAFSRAEPQRLPHSPRAQRPRAGRLLGPYACGERTRTAPGAGPAGLAHRLRTRVNTLRAHRYWPGRRQRERTTGVLGRTVVMTLLS